MDEKDLIGLILGVFPALAFASYVYRDYLTGTGRTVDRAYVWFENGLFGVVALEIVLIAFSVR